MFSSLRLILLIFAYFLLAVAGQAQSLQVAPQDGVLVLLSGSLLSGKISRVGDRYYVVLPDGEIRVRAADVEMFCSTVDEAYRRKSMALRDQRAEKHLDLAEWCLRHKLWGYAAKELLAAGNKHPNHPRISLLERKLQLAIHPVRIPRASSSAAEHRATSDQLDKLVRTLPRGSVETFTSVIQPLLLNRCATAGCHGPASKNKLRLERLSAGRPVTRRITQRNLHATLRSVNRSEPDSSPLLTRPISPHGTMKAAIFTQKDLKKYQQLVQWVNRIAKSPMTRQPSSVVPGASPLLQTIDSLQTINPQPVRDASPFPSVQRSTLPVKNPSDEKAAKKLQQGTAGDDGKGPKPKQGPQRGAKLPKPKSADPFDPEIFNRQFGAGKK